MLKSPISARITAFNLISVRQGHWPPKKPRSYRRRLFDAAFQPMAPETRRLCPPFNDFLATRQRKECNEYQLALVKHTREKLTQDGYQVMAICHQLSVKKRDEWLVRNRFRQKGMELKTYDNLTLSNVFSGTPLETLNKLLVATNCQLFGHDADAIQLMLNECKRIHWLTPLAFVYGSRILSVEEAQRLCNVGSMEEHRAQTVQLLTQPLSNVVEILNYHLFATTNLLTQMVEKMKTKSHTNKS